MLSHICQHAFKLILWNAVSRCFKHWILRTTLPHKNSPSNTSPEIDDFNVILLVKRISTQWNKNQCHFVNDIVKWQITAVAFFLGHPVLLCTLCVALDRDIWKNEEKKAWGWSLFDDQGPPPPSPILTRSLVDILPHISFFKHAILPNLFFSGIPGGGGRFTARALPASPPPNKGSHTGQNLVQISWIHSWARWPRSGDPFCVFYIIFALLSPSPDDSVVGESGVRWASCQTLGSGNWINDVELQDLGNLYGINTCLFPCTLLISSF